MPKIKIKVEIENSLDKQTIETQAILEEDIIKYYENDKTRVIMNLKDKTLIRENDKLKLYYSFKTGKGLIEVKEYSKIIDMDLNVIKMTRRGNSIRVVYKIDNEEFIYKVGEIK